MVGFSRGELTLLGLRWYSGAVVVLLVSLFLLLLPADSNGQAIRFETRPFRDHQWGDPLSTFGEVQLVRSGNVLEVSVFSYRKVQEEVVLGDGFLASSIEYVFLNDRLLGVVIFLSQEIDLTNASTKVKELAQEYAEIMAKPASDEQLLANRAGLVTNLFLVLQDILSEEWGTPKRTNWELAEWIDGTEEARLVRGSINRFGHEPNVLFLSDEGVYTDWLTRTGN